MTSTSNIGMTLVDQSQAQKEVTINQALTTLDAFIGNTVADKDLSAPPVSTATGVVYIVAASPTGAWAGKATYLAYFDQLWRFVAPQTGMCLWVKDESAHYRFDGTTWVIVSGGGGGAVASVFTRTGAVTAQSGDYNTSQVVESGNLYFTNARAISSSITGYASGAGTVAATDTILQAIQKLNGNDDAKAPLVSPTFTGTVTLPSGQVVNGVTLSTAQGTGNFLRGDGAYAAPSAGAGDVVGPASATDNAVARFDTTTGKLVQNSGVLIDDSDNITGVGTLASGSQTITGTETISSTSAAALVVGANGATNPALKVDASTASSATGIVVKSAAAAGGVSITATSSGTNETLNITSKGTGNVALNSANNGNISFQTNITQRAFVGPSATGITPGGRTSSVVPFFAVTGGAGTTLTASTEAPLVSINLASTQTHSTGALTLQRDFRVINTTHAFSAASTLTDAATFAVDGAPVAGTNASVTNANSIYSAGSAVGAGTTNSYGLRLTANSGATNNYITSFNGTAGEVFRLRTDGQVALLATNTAGGTTVAQTINKPSGTVNFAAAAAALVVTNSLCTTSSIIFAVIRTDDATALIKNVIPAAGSFTINLNAAATAETSVGFFIIN